jgi:hypothetical protein
MESDKKPHRKDMKKAYFLPIILLLTSCTASRLEFARIDFKAGACFGTCPIFNMTISNNGKAHFSAESYNKREGQFDTVIQGSQLDSLNKLISESGLSDLKSEYSMDWTDHPTYILTIKLKNGQTKTITDYGPSGPDKLKRIYDKIFGLRESQDWK